MVSDTHVPTLARRLPDRLYEEMEGCSVVLHAGDLVSTGVIDSLSMLLPFYGVHGNQDSPSVRARLPSQRVVKLEGRMIGLVHGHEGKGMYTEDRAFNTFEKEDVDIVVFGHSHQPVNEQRGGVLMFNPGSPVAGRGGKGNTYGVLDIGNRKVEGRIIALS